MDDVGYVLLAGGAGRRMGKQNKLNMAYHDETFGDILKNQLRALGEKRYISIAEYEYQIQDDFEVIVDEVMDEKGQFIGPLGGIFSALNRAYENGLRGIFVVSCDMPLFHKEIFSAMEDYISEHDIVLVRTADGHVHYTCGYYSVEIQSVLKEMIAQKNYRIREVFNRCNTYVGESCQLVLQDEWFTNVNDMEQYTKIICN